MIECNIVQSRTAKRTIENGQVSVSVIAAKSGYVGTYMGVRSSSNPYVVSAGFVKNTKSK